MNRPCTDGFAFVEFVDSHPSPLRLLFHRMGFREQQTDDTGRIVAMTQGTVTFVVNSRPNSFYDRHGASVRGLALRAFDPRECAARAVAAGAHHFEREQDGEPVIAAPAVRGIGGSLLYFVATGSAPFDGMRAVSDASPGGGSGITELDHTSHIVRPENLDAWAAFYTNALDFTQHQYLDVRGQASGMRARSMIGPCRKVRIPIAASAHDDPGVLNQNEEFIRDYKGEGIQHIALGTDDIFRTVDALREAGFEFMEAPPAQYYEDLDRRVPNHGYPLSSLADRGLLVDGTSSSDMLLQIFTRRQIGPIFFELIQRINHAGFGEGNFRALFEAQEKDQLRRRPQSR